MVPYFPFTHDTYEMAMGLRPLDQQPLIEIDAAHYQGELALKAAIIASDVLAYVRALPGSEAAQWEALALILVDLARHAPESFALETTGDWWMWHNAYLGSTTRFRYGDPATLPHAPLDWVGRQVQEDLLLLDGNVPGCPLIAGQLCFANMWSLAEKLGQSFLAIHDPVPLFAAQIGRPSDLLMARLKAQRPVWRLNWSLTATARLNLAPWFAADHLHSKHAVTAKSAGEQCFLRVERQGLARLPQSNAVLFTIHTYVAPVGDEARNLVRAQRLLGVLRTAPETVLAYKGITPFAAALRAYLEQALATGLSSHHQA